MSGNNDESAKSEDERVEEIVRAGPRGALTVAGIAVAIVTAIWFLFYFLVFLPRGVIH
ncbi:hypothetical protein ACFFJT_06405 [Dyella flava]|uniref:Cytochrome c oxidase subunit IIa family protein n=1 Tax=Dyella flava TaxID=1920170 RepID=A0ABS2K0V8_9GAMM|nr:hypothetical protein [Dyella flava]MBM7124874.1 hypothetical protein [Dyella flava]GLQ50915.1 hypothetical protein GCM10010872_23640 [Dyella flava]